MWSPGVDIARRQYKAHDIFVEQRDLDFQIDFTSYLVPRSFARDNPDLVRAVIAALREEAAWSDEHPLDSEIIAQRKANYSDEIRDYFVTLHRRYTFYEPNDKAFVARLQSAADWLTERKVLPEQVMVAEYLAPA